MDQYDLKGAGPRYPWGSSRLTQSRQAKAESICQWFLSCANPATTTVPHPVLGDVPCCETCARFARS